MKNAIEIIVGLLFVGLSIVLASILYVLYLVLAIIYNSIWYIVDEPRGFILLTPLGMIRLYENAYKKYGFTDRANRKDLIRYLYDGMTWRP